MIFSPLAVACRPGARRAARAGTASTALPATTAFVLLALARLGSAALNIIHDCDETFNYLEPLHYFLHGSGMQTWEYSAQFALRSWLYLLLHAPAAGAPVLLGLGAGRGECCKAQGSAGMPGSRAAGSRSGLGTHMAAWRAKTSMCAIHKCLPPPSVPFLHLQPSF